MIMRERPNSLGYVLVSHITRGSWPVKLGANIQSNTIARIEEGYIQATQEVGSPGVEASLGSEHKL